MSAQQEGDVAVVSVRDTGIGLPPDKLESIFGMFTQIDKTLERARGGLGIGLTLARRLVELHGGTVAAHSRGLGHGSEFIVRLPATAAAQGERATHATRPADAKGRRILVVDDNPDNTESLSLLLQMSGNLTETASDGPQAVKKALEFQPDIVLLDLGLPVMSGYDVCRTLREQPAGRSIAIVAVSGWGQDEDRRKSREAGFDAHLVKPVDFAELAKLLATVGPNKR